MVGSQENRESRLVTKQNAGVAHFRPISVAEINSPRFPATKLVWASQASSTRRIGEPLLGLIPGYDLRDRYASLWHLPSDNHHLVTFLTI